MKSQPHWSGLRGNRRPSPAERQSRAANQHVSPQQILSDPWLRVWVITSLCLIPNLNESDEGFTAELLRSFYIFCASAASTLGRTLRRKTFNFCARKKRGRVARATRLIQRFMPRPVPAL